MRILAFIMLVALFIVMIVHIIQTNVSIEEMKQIDKDALDFARYCYNNNYTPEECR